MTPLESIFWLPIYYAGTELALLTLGATWRLSEASTIAPK